MHFASPLAFLLLLLLPPVYYFGFHRRSRAALIFSDGAGAAALPRTARIRCEAWLPWVRMAALFLLVVALARPQQGQERIRDKSEGIAIEMVLDRSTSMSAEMAFDGRVTNRLEVVKRVFTEFVVGNGDTLSGRPNDLIGLVVFAGYADTIAPLTLGHDTLVELVNEVEMPTRRSEDGTAIGDALALAAARLKTAEEAQIKVNARLGKDYEIKSKIIILLTDGQNNRGEKSPEEAARLAKSWDIRIYTIGIGGESPTSRFQGPLGAMMMPQEFQMDEEMLRDLAELTGGVYHRADSANALREIYEEIGRLETSEIESLRYMDYQERFLPFALLAFALLFAEALLRATWLRRHP